MLSDIIGIVIVSHACTYVKLTAYKQAYMHIVSTYMLVCVPYMCYKLYCLLHRMFTAPRPITTTLPYTQYPGENCVTIFCIS